MKITKEQLVKVIKEELEAVMGEDQGMFARGAKGAGRDEISVEKIRISPDGSFKARLTSAALEKPIRVAGRLDDDSRAKLSQAGAIETPKELTGAAKEMMGLVDTIKSSYEGGEAGMPPSVEQVAKLVRSSDFEGLKDTITDLWNDLLRWHQGNGTRPQQGVLTSFNNLNTLLRKQTG